MFGMICGNRERVHAVGPAVEQDVVAVLKRLQPADPGRNRRADPLGLGLDVETRVGLGLASSGDDHLREAVHAPRLLVVDPCLGSKSFSSHAKVTGYALASNCSIAAAPDLPGQQVVPRRLDVVPERRHSAHAGDHHPAAPVLLVVAHIAHIPSPPSTSSTSPVMNEASSEHRNRTAPATSSGSPSLPSGVFVEHRLLRLLGQHVRQPRVDVARRDDVCTHAAAAELTGERLREADDSGLRRCVVRLAPVAPQADDARHVDDRAGAPFHHSSRRRTARVEDAAQVRVDHRTPVVVGHPSEHPVAGEPRVVDEDVQVAGLLDERARLVRARDVRLERRVRRFPWRPPRLPPLLTGSRPRPRRRPCRARPRSPGRCLASPP